ncbi:MAG: glutamine-hydrolyzing carbamoyl-phosphate synthase small subunit [Candidatus Gastranaerophilales bacterium]|nr:glutamine-hydrolyzing carbamoyl-phosphate synthase small subunit [Candidatus Gastranaerophilales bacterium]
MNATLLLEDGTKFEGKSFGSEGTRFGELVFNTSMTGYQEILTDPSYAGQIITMTYPEIGNYGINQEDFESEKPATLGFIVKNNCEKDSHYNSTQTISKYLKDNGIIGISGVDTRALTRKIREFGSMNAVVTTEEITENLKTKLAKHKPDKDIVLTVTRKDVKILPNTGIKMAFIDYGAKSNIINNLHEKGCDLTIFPADVDAETILTGGFDALFLSNGPGDPQDVTYSIKTIKRLTGKIPIFGICLGHQILSLVLGAKTYKLKYGHRGGNHPVINLQTKKVMMTSQNHSYAVDESTLPKNAIVTYKNLNDDTIEGLSYPNLNIESVQFHPEAAPGPFDANEIFDNWIANLKNNIPKSKVLVKREK